MLPLSRTRVSRCLAARMRTPVLKAIRLRRYQPQPADSRPTTQRMCRCQPGISRWATDMALYHVFDEVENRRTGIPMSGVMVKAYFRGTNSIAPIFADENGTPFAPVNQTETYVDGMYSFYVCAGEYDLHLLIGTS